MLTNGNDLNDRLQGTALTIILSFLPSSDLLQLFQLKNLSQFSASRTPSNSLTTIYKSVTPVYI